MSELKGKKELTVKVDSRLLRDALKDVAALGISLDQYIEEGLKEFILKSPEEILLTRQELRLRYPGIDDDDRDFTPWP